MKKTFLIFMLTVTFGLPVLAPLAPHDLLHNLHDSLKTSFIDNTHSTKRHEHNAHSHAEGVVQNDHHLIHFDVVSYFNDYLHVDLQNTQGITFKTPQQQDQKADSDLLKNILKTSITIASIQSRAPPNYYNDKIYYIDKTYLTTQRIRI